MTHSSSTAVTPNPNTITVQLVDSASGRIVQAWQFPPLETISIGRAAEREVSIADPYVSRHHAELRLRDGAWWLVALGRNGVLVNGRSITETEIPDGGTFRLSSSGPILRFYSSPLADRELPTLSGVHDAAEFLPQINTEKRDEEVRGIVETDYFKKLREQARELRKGRDTEIGGASG
ncbi:MAG: FHA domain-containing protein [Planctomycetia bacterium]|nr:FHA domain-containing protein [Planctomycetia bacterium]